MITTLFVLIILTITELVRVKQQLNDYNIVLIILTITELELSSSWMITTFIVSIILTITELVRVKQQLNDYNIHCFDHFNNYRVSKS